MNLRVLAFSCVLSAVCIARSAEADTTFTLNPNTADNVVINNGSGTLSVGSNSTDYQARIGEYFAPGGSCYVAPFQIPSLPAGETFSAATLRLQLFALGGTPANADLYVVRTNTAPTVLTSDYYQGSSPDSRATLLQAGLLTMSSTVRANANTGPFITSSPSAGTTLAAYLNSVDSDNSLAGSYLFLRISYAQDTIPNGNNYYSVLTEDAGGSAEKPLLTLMTSATAVPEPSTLTAGGLLALLAGPMVVRRLRRRPA